MIPNAEFEALGEKHVVSNWLNTPTVMSPPDLLSACTFAALLPDTPTVETASARPKPIAIWRTRRERLTFNVMNFPLFSHRVGDH